MLKYINLTLSSACGADCLFCPSNRGERIKQKVMPFELVKKIVDEVASKDFSEKHRIEQISVGENGDAFLNKDLIEVLQYIRLKLPGIKTVLFTNFQNFLQEKSKIILNEKLIDNVICNIDGSNARNYFLVKRIDYNVVKKNLIDFLRIRKALESEVPLYIAVCSFNRYVKTIRANFGFYPSKLKEYQYGRIADDSEIIKKQWEKALDSKKDIIHRTNIYGWAERDKMSVKKINYKLYTCPLLCGIKEAALIAPDGTWYGCCYDANNELVLGNITVDSIDTVYNGQRRKAFIEFLEKKEFYKIEGPCKTVNCCQELPSELNLKKIFKKLVGPNLFYKIKMLYSKSQFFKSLSDKFSW